jgi:hypothetical protein
MTETNEEDLLGIPLRMSVVEYGVRYERARGFLPSTGEHVVGSYARLALTVEGATVEHHDNRPIIRVTLHFSEGPSDSDSDSDQVGWLFEPDPGTNPLVVVSTLPWADFPAFWAVLSAEGQTILVCTIAEGTDRVLSLSVHSGQVDD